MHIQNVTVTMTTVTNYVATASANTIPYFGLKLQMFSYSLLLVVTSRIHTASLHHGIQYILYNYPLKRVKTEHMF